jgi:hypothetical protein
MENISKQLQQINIFTDLSYSNCLASLSFCKY